MPSVADAPACRCDGCPGSPRNTLIVDPLKAPSVETVQIDRSCPSLLPFLVLPGGARVCVDAFGVDPDGADWWKDLAVAAIYASLCYQPGSERLR